MLIHLKKNGQTASIRTRKILNRGLGSYILLDQSDDSLHLRCIATKWQGWIKKAEVVITKINRESTGSSNSIG